MDLDLFLLYIKVILELHAKANNNLLGDVDDNITAMGAFILLFVVKYEISPSIKA